LITGNYRYSKRESDTHPPTHTVYTQRGTHTHTRTHTHTDRHRHRHTHTHTHTHDPPMFPLGQWILFNSEPSE
jgi:hypothetical protein